MLSAAAQSFRSVTHKEDAVNFVMDVFRSMGGTINVVAPPEEVTRTLRHILNTYGCKGQLHDGF